MAEACPSRTLSNEPELASQTLANFESPPVTKVSPSGLNAIACNIPSGSCTSDTRCPLFASQTRASSPYPAVANRAPSRDKLIAQIHLDTGNGDWFAWIEYRSRPLTSNRFSTPSWSPVNSDSPSGWKSKQRIQPV